MKNLYRLQTLLVVLCSLLALPWAHSQLATPLTVNVKNSGSSFNDQFPASLSYAYGIVQDVNPSLGLASITTGSGSNTLRVTFTAAPGAVGTTDLIVTYFTLSAPIHPVTRSYHFIISDEIIIATSDRYVVDSGSVDVALDVLSNDSTSAGNITLTTVSVSNAGTATINTNGDAILFTPDPEFAGDTWLQYIACDSAGNCGEGKVHVLVRNPNAQDNIAYTKFLLNQEVLHVLTPFENFGVSIVPAHGTLDSLDASSWSYTPDEGFTGQDTFELSLLNLSIRKYIITVYEKATNIQAKDDKFYVRPGLSVTFNVLNNDLLDFPITDHTNPTKGILSDLGNGLFTYSPNNGYRGVDKFTYTACYDDTVYCETATVLLHVTDLEPENVFTYKLQTSTNLPLTIDYPIEYTDFSYIVSDDPEHGDFTFYAGVQNIALPCDTIEAYNMLVYEPEAGYTGPDHFEYYYCIQPSNICYLVKVDMNVIEAPEPETCACVVDCVWPGDNDRNGRVDMGDLLSMGYYLGATGQARPYADPATWFGQSTGAWPGANDDEGIQYKDGNGDGSITADDVDMIDQHYYRAHDIVARDVQQKLPYQFSIIPVQFSLDSGDLVILDIALGNANVPVLDMKGTKFSINVPPQMMDSSTVEVTFHQDAWLAEGSPNISLGKVPWDGRIDAGFVKANGNGASGFGVIATVVFIIEDDLEGFKTNDGFIRIPVSLSSGVAMDERGILYDVDGDETYIILDLNKSRTNPYSLIVYPNPAQDLVNVHLNGKTSMQSISIVDPQGRILREVTGIDAKHHQLDVSMLPNGLYYLQVHHDKGMMTQLLSVIR